jgi:hypothetical protein
MYKNLAAMVVAKGPTVREISGLSVSLPSVAVMP